MEVNPKTDDVDWHRLVTCLVAPRPIGWMSTVSDDGAVNLAPFSYFNAVSTDPPVLAFSPKVEDGTPKDTARNVLDNGEFVANLVTERLAAAMDRTAAPFDPGESEFEAAELSEAPSAVVDPPRVAEADASMECVLHDTVRVYDHHLFLGEVVRFHVDEPLLTDGRIDMLNVDTVGRLGGPYYTRIDLLDVERRY